MFEKLPSLRGFHPEWFTGGPAGSYLPLIHDLVALTEPKSIVTLGFADGQVHFAFCQAAREADLSTRCVALRRDDAEDEKEDEPWMRGLESGKELYGETSALISESRKRFASGLPLGVIDILFIDEIDSGAELEAILSRFDPVMASDGLILFHGLSLERADAPRLVWEKWATGRRAVAFSAGLGLGIASAGLTTATQYDWLFAQERAADLAVFYQLAAERMEAQRRATGAAREVASLNARQIWIDALLADNREAQRTVAEQARLIANLQPRVEAWQRDRESLQRDRAQAQLVMDAQSEQVKHWTALAQHYQTDRDKYKLQANEQKEILKVARKACRKKGKCFQLPHEKAEKKQRPISERILREIKRVPENLLGGKATSPPAPESDAPGDAPPPQAD